MGALFVMVSPPLDEGALRVPDGACCHPGGGCSWVKGPYCTQLGGEWHMGVTCEDQGCDHGACCFDPRGCEDMDAAPCQAAGGTWNPNRKCSDDICPETCCRGTPPNAMCAYHPPPVCASLGGTTVYDYSCDDDDPCNPGACCLCRGQCVDWPAITTRTCAALEGEWHSEKVCEEVGANCDDTRPQACCNAAFVFRKNAFHNKRYPYTTGRRIAPHEYERGRFRDNAKVWRAHISARYGLWGCGQWDMDRPETKEYFRGKVHFRTGLWDNRAQFWALYVPICPEYEMEAVT